MTHAATQSGGLSAVERRRSGDLAGRLAAIEAELRGEES